MPRVVMVSLLCAAAVAAPVPKAATKGDLDGRWEIVELNSGNSDLTKLNPWVWDIQGEKVTAFSRAKDGRLDPHDSNTVITLVRPDKERPDHLDYRRKVGCTDYLQPALLKVDGDTLTICFGDNQTRPNELKAGESVTLMRFKRVTEK